MSSQQPDDSGMTPPPDAAQAPEASQAASAPPPGSGQGRPGVRLLAERRAQGLSLGDVARQLKLSVRQVEALERDEYSAFPGPVFVRGFLRNYAKLLQLDPEAVVAQAALAPAPVPATPAGSSIATTPVPLQESAASRRGARFGFGTMALGLMLVLLIVVVAAIYDARNKPTPVSLVPSPAGSTTAAPAPQHADSPPPAAPGTTTVVPETPPAATAAPAASGEAVPAPPADDAGAAATPVVPTAAPAAAPGPGEVKLVFDSESWVEIRDATGVVIFSRLNPAGTEQVVTGEPPLDVVIGNAGSVQLTYRSKAVDLAPHTRVDVARVRLE